MSDTRAKKTKLKRWRRKRAHMRARTQIRGTAERPRLAVFKSLRHVYAQLIDDEGGRTLTQASTLDSEVQGKIESGSANTRAAARLVGATVGERAKEKGIEAVVFDRGGYIYHGKVKEVAEGAREKGLRF